MPPQKNPILCTIHYSSAAEKLFYVSYLQSILITDPAGVQGYHDLVTNILDYLWSHNTTREDLKMLLH